MFEARDLVHTTAAEPLDLTHQLLLGGVLLAEPPVGCSEAGDQ